MDELEFKELFRQLEEQGWNPQRAALYHLSFVKSYISS